MINSAYWPRFGEVAAFEELVGSHGGLGGTQCFPFVLHPAELEWPDEEVVGAESDPPHPPRLARPARSRRLGSAPPAESSYRCSCAGPSSRGFSLSRRRRRTRPGPCRRVQPKTQETRATAKTTFQAEVTSCWLIE